MLRAGQLVWYFTIKSYRNGCLDIHFTDFVKQNLLGLGGMVK